MYYLFILMEKFIELYKKKFCTSGFYYDPYSIMLLEYVLHTQAHLNFIQRQNMQFCADAVIYIAKKYNSVS